MSDLTPAPFLAVPETDDFAAARASLLAGAAKWRQVKADLRDALGEFFYDRALILTRKDYDRLLRLGADEFELSVDTIVRYRTQYQLKNGLVPPTPESERQQKRSITKPSSARGALPQASAGGVQGTAAPVDPPAEPLPVEPEAPSLPAREESPVSGSAVSGHGCRCDECRQAWAARHEAA